MRILWIALSAALAIAPALSTDAFAHGRKGSHRVGGTNGHGKGSHYIGGRSGSLEVPKLIQLAGNECNDGTYSQSSGQGTCSHHGGERK